MKRTLCGFAVLCLVWAPLAEAGPLAPSKPSQVVTVMTSSTNCAYGTLALDTQINPEGTTVPFAIPAGKVFVITNYDATSWSGDSLPNRNYAVIIQVNNQWLFEDVIATDGYGFGGKSGSVGNIVVKPGATLCANVGALNTIGGLFRVHGFLTSDK